MQVIDKIKEARLVPVVVINKLEDTESIVGALVEGGLPFAEITFRTECAKDAIALATKKFPEALIGAGTVINAKQCEEAIKVGAKFIVSPGLSKEVFEVCKKHDVTYLPGCVTPTEIMEALSYGLTTLKFFPASNYGGVKTLKALSGPFPQVNFMPTGGINPENLSEYLSLKKIIACGGSWMVKGNHEEILKATKEAVNLLKTIK